MAASRPGGGSGAHHDAGPGRNCLRGRVGCPGHLRSLRHDRAAPCVCALWPEPDPRAGTGFLARRRDPRRRAAALASRSRASRDRGEPDGGRLRPGMHPDRRAAAGFVTELLSKPIRYGYMNGIALTVLISQLPKLFGFSIDVAAGLFQGFPISSSSSRTPVAEAAGAKTQLTGVFGAVFVALLLILAPNLLRNLPSSALAAVVIAAAIGLFEFADLRRILRVQPWEFWLSIVCFVGVAVFGVIPGIGLAVLLAVIEFLWDGWRPHHAVLGRVDGIRGYHDLKRYPEARLVPGLVLFRWDAPLFFANAELFHQSVLNAVAQSPTKVRRIVVTAEPVTSIDVPSADMLDELEQYLREAGIELRFAEMKDPVKDKLKRFELYQRFGTFYPTVGAAVDGHLEDYSLDWKP